MMEVNRDRWICTDCRWLGGIDEVPKIDHPFREGDDVIFCPECKEAETIVRACEVVGCGEESTCGTMTEDYGYLALCGDHFRELQ